MALYAFDGTGKEDRRGDVEDSNVVALFDAYDDPGKFDADEDTGSIYFKGIGQSALTKLGSLIGQALGIGAHKRNRRAMNRLESNIEAGDSAIDIVGFSRGAANAISFANEVHRQHPELEIRFIGLFDVVGQFGAPGEQLQAGHDLKFPMNARHVYHAMAMDERRLLFPLTRLIDSRPEAGGRLTEVWFRGVHSDVGGGNENGALNSAAMQWMFECAEREGARFISEIRARRLDRGGDYAMQSAAVRGHDVEVGPRREFLAGDHLHSTVRLGDGINNPTVQLARFEGPSDRVV